MHRLVCLLLAGLLSLAPGYGRQAGSGCGTTRERLQEDIELHRRTLKLRAQSKLRALSAVTPRADIGEIAIIEHSDGVVSSLDQFNLNSKSLTFTPASAPAPGYKAAVGDSEYDAAAASAGVRLTGMGDDDNARAALPFAFPFFGRTYQQVYINSDGNLTFGAPESSSMDRSIGRFAAGPPRIAALFSDLDPSVSSDGVRVLASDPARFVVSWVAVPVYSDAGLGRAQTFQATLYPDGRIRFDYNNVGTETNTVVGVAPGASTGATSVVSYMDSSTAGQVFTAAVAERFSTARELDTLAAAQKFYLNHEDSYDYLVMFNNEDLEDSPGSIASARVARTHWTGNGDTATDAGAWFGSSSRLMSVINMAHLSQYPANLTSPMSRRPEDTPLSILAHEAGHLWLAYASIADASATWGLPMLGGQAAHWSFNFNSEASLLEGNRIADDGAGAAPRFQTVGSAEAYSPLDQYLMGFRAPGDVTTFHKMFYVTGSPYASTKLPQTGLGFNGARRDVALDELIAAVGRRTPDYSVAQRHFRFGFMLIVRPGTQPTQPELAKLNDFRTQFEAYYRAVSACDLCGFAAPQPTTDTTLRRVLRFTGFPNVGVMVNGKIRAAVSTLTPVESALVVNLSAPGGVASVPSSVTIPAGGVSATFEITGVSAGVEELTAAPADARYETVYSRVQVGAGLPGLRVIVKSGGSQAGSSGLPLAQPVALQVVDVNNVPYPNVKVTAAVTAGGTVTPASATSDETGTVSFQWTLGSAESNDLTASIEGGDAAGAVTVAALMLPSFTRAGVVDAASFTPAIGLGSIASVFGANLWAGADADAPGLPWPATLAGVRVFLDGQAARITAVRRGQVNFLIPSDRAAGTARMVVANPIGESAPVDITLASVAPAIFGDGEQNGAVQALGTGQWTRFRPAHANEYIEIYGTGFGAVHLSARQLQETDQAVSVFLAGQPLAEVLYSGLVPGYVGLYQINARLPANVTPGLTPLEVEIGGRRSNTVKITVE
jgi:uncharacterized protein (TIGR03437 family)